MPPRKEHDFAEVLVDHLILESFSNEQSPYFPADREPTISAALQKLESKLKYHVSHSLSHRQKDVVRRYLRGATEREIAAELGVSQQVVHIYKQRAIKRLHKLLISEVYVKIPR
jgi:DNA-binding NarL/FixJ family response regulator